MIAIAKYLGKIKIQNSVFTPEYKTAKAINLRITELNYLKREDVLEIITMVNSTDAQTQRNGSGWMDYKIHLSALLNKNGFELDWGHDRPMQIRKDKNL